MTTTLLHAHKQLMFKLGFERTKYAPTETPAKPFWRPLSGCGDMGPLWLLRAITERIHVSDTLGQYATVDRLKQHILNVIQGKGHKHAIHITLLIWRQYEHRLSNLKCDLRDALVRWVAVRMLCTLVSDVAKLFRVSGQEKKGFKKIEESRETCWNYEEMFIGLNLNEQVSN